MARYERTNEDSAVATEEKSAVKSMCLILLTAVVAAGGVYLGIAYYKLSVQNGVPYLRFSGIQDTLLLRCLIVGPVFVWLVIAAVYVRRLPLWVYFAESPYARERNALCIALGVIAAQFGALVTSQVLWAI